jgi:6-phosphofructo-2-kinase/fructose-2,6-biphosphatase 4
VTTDVRDANNFYENYAESTKGKRKVGVEHWAAETVEAGAGEFEETKAPKEQHVESGATASVVASADPPTITANEQI